MPEEKFNPDSFAPFLESIQGPVSQPPMKSILKVLAESEEGMDTATLASKTELPIDVLASGLQELKAQQLVTRWLRGSREYWSLTDGGKNLLKE